MISRKSFELRTHIAVNRARLQDSNLRVLFILTLVVTILFDLNGAKGQAMTEIQSLFKEHCVVPDVISIPPPDVLTVKYPSGSTVETAKELTPTQVKDQPTVTWAAKEQEYYTLAMVDPDAPSREHPKFREWHHWLVGNILGTNVGKGEILSDYIGSGPPKGTGLHRYVFLVYKQPEKCDFSKVIKLPNNSGDKRGKFSIAKFAQQFKLGTPVAGNFYVAKYDDYVPKLYAKLKG
ncbi:protein D3 [Helicoverpa armigera]|uniref:protein D3 n=1 Tax=Helicoverpa armigera TaxID=29058 RepID=UPI0030827CF9